MKEIIWSVLGTGVIANQMAVALAKNGKKISAIGNRTYSKGVAFAEKYGISKVYDDFNEMFTDPDIDVIYITTPHNTHLGFVKQALEGGKHVLVEGTTELIRAGENEDALAYELSDMEAAINGDATHLYFDYTVDVMDMMTKLRHSWGITYPGETKDS